MTFNKVCNQKHLESSYELGDSQWWSEGCSCCCYRVFYFLPFLCKDPWLPICGCAFQPLIKERSADCCTVFTPDDIRSCIPIWSLIVYLLCTGTWLVSPYSHCAKGFAVWVHRNMCWMGCVLIWQSHLHPFQGPFMLLEHCKQAVVVCTWELSPVWTERAQFSHLGSISHNTLLYNYY